MNEQQLDKFCDSLTQYKRRETNTVRIGNLLMGGQHPIRLQSMTNTNTQDIPATAEQCKQIIDAGADLVRITAPGIRDAECLADIKALLRQAGYEQPLVADIHFNPNAASVAAERVEKVRVNPGNFVDKKKFEHIEYTDQAYAEELERIREKFVPLLRLCKQHHTAVRIGTNHGSLSDRILSRYGDTPMGMVESALEFLRICQQEDFHHVVLSMKASNTHVMVRAYRLLVAKMAQEGMHYPLHLGVTEAGEAEDGRVKSAVGIGSLLADGLGDTVRVSLTEDPVAEIPVAKALVEHYQGLEGHRPIAPIDSPHFNPFEYRRRDTLPVQNIGGEAPPVVIVDFSTEKTIDEHSLRRIGYIYLPKQDKWIVRDQAPEFIYVNPNYIDPRLPSNIKLVAEYETYQELKARGVEVYPIVDQNSYSSSANTENRYNFVRVNYQDFNPQQALAQQNDPTLVYLLEVKRQLQSPQGINTVAEQRAFFLQLLNLGIRQPVVLHQDYNETTFENLQLHAAADLGPLFVDGFGDGIFVRNLKASSKPEQINALSFNILQASRVRTSKTEYISCPSCGRTLFDLQSTTARIRQVTNHLKGLKIGIMGCIVNGPGEMADAHYGYVGTGPGRITLYKGQEVVRRNIPSDEAVDALIELIKANNDWVEPTQVE